MGGVPFKSKACNTCRRRKVKCDETKPECLRCLNNGHVCAGYERQHVFINTSTDPVKGLARRPRNPIFTKGVTAKSSPAQSEAKILRFDTNAALRTQFVANFIDCFAPSPLIRDGKSHGGLHLQDTFVTFIGRSPVLDKAVTALGTAFLAKRQQDSGLLRYSTMLYGDALRIVHSRIQSGRRCGQDSLFATVIFQLYELINSSPLGFKAWLAHIQGSNAILSEYSASDPPSATDHLFWRQLKFVTICDAIGMRKSVYGYSPFWERPSPNNPWREPVDVILDGIVEYSALMEQIDLLIQSGNPELQADYKIGERLLHDCLTLKDQLDTDFNKMQKELGYPYSSPHQYSFWSDLDESIPDDIFPDAIEYPSLSCAEAHVLWFTTYILLYPLIDQLLIFLGRSPRTVPFTLWTVPTSLSPSESDYHPTRASEIPESLLEVAEHYADMICRSAKFMVQPETKALGAQIFLAPFSQALQFYHSQETIHKHRWCQSVFMVLPRLGFGIAPFLKDMIWPKYEAATKKSPSTSPQSMASTSSSTSG